MKIIEFLGSSRAGKTEQIKKLSKYFTKLNIKHKVITDREIEKEIKVPFEDVFEYNLVFFNKIFERIQEFKTDCEIIILDRGFLDAEAWINTEHQRGKLSDVEMIKFLDYVGLLQKKYLNLAFFMIVEPEITLLRHQKTEEHSSADDYIMNQEYIEHMHKVYLKMMEYHKEDKHIIFLDGNNSLEHLEALIVSKINNLLVS